ncbi:DASH family cryptochrome [Alteromonas gilva]|uniref:Cryptochrome DASH n=1 Tax=Alteromonas gilva TaxID=2987522 RepID=A0ABT5L205_9ALTE|nr:DASH family cryptochrome [Alteromonas gilva]MDC8831057.1 DASH family cryptochrome [Alteromonas gilva]
MKNTQSTGLSTGLYWFRHDLRLDDQPALARLAACTDRVILVYCIDPHWFIPDAFGCSRMGIHRQQFIYESLIDLNRQLEGYHQNLLVVVGEPVSQLMTLIQQYDVTVLGFGEHPGFEERDQIDKIKQHIPDLTTISAHNNSLFEPEVLPFSISEMPDKFSPFRKKIEKHLNPLKSIARPVAIPPPPAELIQTDWQGLPLHHGSASSFNGGETAGRKQLHHYFFESQGIADYKSTRNGLEGWHYSSKFSAWLASGCLSVKYVVSELHKFEKQVTANESTYWLYFELLWREFFWWLQRKHGRDWFTYGGLQHSSTAAPKAGDALHNWQNGTTANAHINACMRQLNATGYMSNRGRQWVASYLINELRQDWRYGAAYFEQQLIDYDVGANWGNWQYLAGVGSDPRGLRQFNIARQAAMYDPQDSFRKLWAG